jgi:hypothetical protein
MNLYNDLIKIPQAEQSYNLLQSAASEPQAELNGGIEAGAYDYNQIEASDILAGSSSQLGRSKLFDYIAGSDYYQKAPANTGGETCRNGKPVPNSQLMCQEFMLNQEPPIVDTIRDNAPLRDFLSIVAGQLDNPVVNILDDIINFVFNLIGTVIIDLAKLVFTVLDHKFPGPVNYILGGFNNLLQHSLPYVMEFIEDIFPPMIQTLTEVIQTPWRLFDAAYTGASYASYQLATGGIDSNGQPYGLGGYDLNGRQSDQLISAANQEYSANEAALPTSQKLFSLTDPNSVFGKLTLFSPIPTNVSELAATLNPLNLLTMPFAAISEAPAHALLEYPTADTNGVPTVGYALNDPQWNSDPFEDPDTCTDNRQIDGLNAIGEPNYATGNMCFMDDAATNIFLAGNGQSPN